VTYGTTNQFAGYNVDKTDSPAVDMQQAGGAFQRLTVSVVIFAGALGAVVLLGFLSLAVILAQVVALVLLGFAPIALVIGIFPGAGHDFFRAWLAKLATAVFIKALYSLVIAIVVAVAAALTSSTDSLGFLFAFGLQTLFFWAIFIYRKQITARLVSATTGAARQDHARPMTVVQRGANVAARPFTALVGVTRRGLGGDGTGSRQQESALAAGDTSSSSPGTSTSAAASTPAAAPSGGGVAAMHSNGRAPVESNGHATPGRRFQRGQLTPGDPLQTPDPRSNGHAEHPSPSAPAAGHDGGPVAGDSAAARRAPDHTERPEATPRASHEDVMRRARELREREREIFPASEERGG
jgi:type IV secretory pathway VirB6-like protein